MAAMKTADGGMLAEFATPEALVRAIRDLRKQGYRALDAFTPYPLHDVEEALELRRSRLPYAIFVGGMVGAGGAYFLQWLLNAYLYPLNAGGRPQHFPPAFVPITFEMGVLLASFTAFIGVLALARLPRLWDPVFEAPGFESATNDRFWLYVSARDRLYRHEATMRALEWVGASRIVPLGRRSF